MWYKYTYSLIIRYISWLYYPRIIYNTYKLTFTLIYYTCYESYKLTIILGITNNLCSFRENKMESAVPGTNYFLVEYHCIFSNE